MEIVAEIQPTDNSTSPPGNGLLPFKARWANMIRKKKVRWLWKGKLQRANLNLLTGDPGTGKSTLVCELVARLSQGQQLEGDPTVRDPMVCWIMSSEDNANDTITWRLENQAADLSRILITDERQELNTKKQLAEFEKVIKEQKVGLVVIDTLTSWMGKTVDMNKTNEVADWTGPLRDIAKRTGCTFLLVRHMAKAASGNGKKAPGMHAGLGSVGFTGGVRSELMVSKLDVACPDGAEDAVNWATTWGTVWRSKGNVGKATGQLAYRIDPHSDSENDHGILSWAPDVTIPKGQAKGSTVPKRLGKATQWLRQELASGPRPAQAIVDAAIKAGFTEATLKRAKLRLAGSSRKEGAVWYWSLEPDAVPEHRVVALPKGDGRCAA